jgi:Family of unknown function (DUF695)
MWPFSNKPLSLGSFPMERGWSLGQGANNGKPMFVRFHAGAKPYAAHPDLPFRLGVTVPLLNPDEHGLPTKAESKTLDEIEDALRDSLQPNEAGFLVLVITTSSMREFVLYVRNPEVANAAVVAAQKCAPKREIQHYVEQDGKWETYHEFA